MLTALIILLALPALMAALLLLGKVVEMIWPSTPAAGVEAVSDPLRQRIQQERDAKAARMAKLPPNTCELCEGVGEIGSVASQRIFTCPDCNGTGTAGVLASQEMSPGQQRALERQRRLVATLPQTPDDAEALLAGHREPWRVDLPDGAYTQLPGDPPGPSALRRVQGGIVYDVQPRTGRLMLASKPRKIPGGATTAIGVPVQNEAAPIQENAPVPQSQLIVEQQKGSADSRCSGTEFKKEVGK